MNLKNKYLSGAVIAAAFIAVILASANAWNESLKYAGCDFYGFWAVPKALSAVRIDNIYSKEGRTDVGAVMKYQAYEQGLASRQKAAFDCVTDGIPDTVHSPFLYCIWNAFSSGNYETDYTRYCTVSMACYAVSIIILCRISGYPMLVSLLLTTYLIFFFTPLSSDIRVANANRIQLALITMMLLSLKAFKKESCILAAGVIGGLMLSFKVTVILAVLFPIAGLLLCRQFRTAGKMLAGITLGVIFAVLVSSAYFKSFACWPEWLKTLPGTLATDYSVNDGNYGLVPLFLDLTGKDLSVFIFTLFTAIFVTTIVLRNPRSAIETLQQRSLNLIPSSIVFGCGVILLSGRLIWLHYYILSIPLLVYALRPRQEKPSIQSRSVMLTVLTVLSLVLISRIPGYILPFSHTAISACLNAAVIIMAGMCVLRSDQ